MEKNYTSVTCFAGSSEDMEDQVSFGINNTTGKAVLRILIAKEVQSVTKTSDIKMTHALCEINGNTVAQLKLVYEYAKQAWEQCSEKEYKEDKEDDFEIYINQKLVKNGL